MTVKVFVGNLNPNSDAQDLENMFAQYGKVTECDIVANYGFVHMLSEADAVKAIENLHETMFDGMKMRCELSTSRTQGRKRARESSDGVPERGRGRGRGTPRGGREGRGGGRFDPYSRDDRGTNGRGRGRGRDGPELRYPPADDPYARDPYARDPYARDPYARDPYARDPYARDPYARDPYLRDPYLRDPYARDRDLFARDPYARDPYARERDPYARDPYARERDPYARDPYARPPPEFYDEGRTLPPRRVPEDPYLDLYDRPMAPRAPLSDRAYGTESDDGGVMRALRDAVSGARGRGRGLGSPLSVGYPARNGTPGQPQQTSLYTAFE